MALQEVGVQAVVKGLSAFQGDMRSMNSSLQSLRGEGTFLQQAFGGITDAILGFGEHIVRIAEVTLGVLLRDAIRAVVDAIKEMASAVFDAGQEFQVLELRLERLNFNDLVESGKSYTEAGREAVKMTQEQLDWLQKLAAATPYGPEDVSNIFTLARSYGFTADEAKKLTEDILNFGSGMGLTNQQVERIIINFGQLVQQGKLNGQELRDLARGAFVPVNDVLKIMMGRMTEAGTITADFTEEIDKEQEKLRGLKEDLEVALQRQSEFTDTTKESTRMANQFQIDELQRKISQSEELIRGYQEQTGKGMQITAENFDDIKRKGLLTGEAVKEFIGAFSDLVEDRFAGAAEKMGRTFKAATVNVKETALGLFGLYTVKPVLDVLGDSIAKFTESFTKTKNWDRLVDAASRLGDALSSVVMGILDLLPSTEGFADTIIDWVDKAAQWVEDNRENIIGFFRGIGETIQNDVIPWIQGSLIPAIQSMIQWIVDHKEEILGFFLELGATIANDVIPFVRDYLLPAFKKFSDWVLENKDLILSLFDQLGDAVLELADFFLPKLEAAMKWIEENPDDVQKVIDAWAKWQVIGTILNIVGGIIISVGGFVLALVGAVSGAIGIFQVFAAVLSSSVAIVIGALILQIISFKNIFEGAAKSFGWWKDFIAGGIDVMKENFQELWQAIQDKDWAAVGEAIVNGIKRGFEYVWDSFKDTIMNQFENLMEDVKGFLGIGSPSRLFFNIGAQTMQGLALGIQKAAGLAAVSMQGAMARVSSAAMPSVTNSTIYNSTANYNLTVNSGAQQEPIVQDFAMMQSLAGV